MLKLWLTLPALNCYNYESGSVILTVGMVVEENIEEGKLTA